MIAAVTGKVESVYEELVHLRHDSEQEHKRRRGREALHVSRARRCRPQEGAVDGRGVALRAWSAYIPG